MSVFYNFTRGIAFILCLVTTSTFAQTFSSAPGASLPDNSCTPSHEFPIEVSMVLPGYLLSEVALDITHTWDSDLDIALIAPDGTVVRLSDDNGGSANNYTDTHFSDAAATAITSGSAPFTGTYRPEEPLSTVSAQGDGTWILRACDDAGGDLGTLNWWSLTFSPPPVSASIDEDCLTAYNGYCTEISVFVSDGVPPYSYLWSDGSDSPTITACPTENTVYSVTVTDYSGVTSTDEVMVVYVPQDVSCGRNNKVQICHRDGKDRGRTLCVAASAVPAHLAHGDTIGSCEETYYTCSTAPSCATITSPMNGAVDVTMPVTVEWSAALGLVDGYYVSVGTTPGGTDVVENTEGGLDLMHTINGLEFETTYYVSVTPYNGNGMAEGCEGISFTTQMNPCNMAPAIGCNETAAGSTVGNLVFNLGTCGTSLSTAPGVWYAFTGTGDIVTVDTNGSSYDTKLGVFTGGCDAPVCLDGDDDGGDGLQSLVTFTSEEGVDYLFYVTGFSSNAGDYVLNVTCETPPPPLTNDDPSGAIALAVSSTCNYTSGTNVGATPTAGVTAPGCAFYSGGDVWFTATTVSGNMTIQGDNNGGFTDGGMAVYTGTPGSLILYACNDDSGPGLHPLINYVGSPGDTVYIRYWEYGNNSFGTFAICAFDAGARPESEVKDIASSTGTIDWSMAPNPTRGDVTLNLSNYLRNNVTVEVIDFTGKVISSQSVRDLQTARYTLELNNSLPSGMYFVRVATDSQVSSKKLVIMR